mmetsp:Transcript_1032/g.4344  ORF Transcript_1032/g.4344 Transcript_1032/m.4344 type:complete len:210 (+) Transcript_1032:1131-1760(+)
MNFATACCANTFKDGNSLSSSSKSSSSSLSSTSSSSRGRGGDTTTEPMSRIKRSSSDSTDAFFRRGSNRPRENCGREIACSTNTCASPTHALATPFNPLTRRSALHRRFAANSPELAKDFGDADESTFFDAVSTTSSSVDSHVYTSPVSVTMAEDVAPHDTSTARPPGPSPSASNRASTRSDALSQTYTQPSAVSAALCAAPAETLIIF